MKALVTGGAGYIGSNLVDRLISEGHEVWVIDNLCQGSVRNIAHLTGHVRFHFCEGTILDQAVMDKLVRQVDMIYHLAAVVGVKYVVDQPLGSLTTNVRGTEIVLETAHRHGVKTLIASSSEVYGKTQQLPLSEDNDRIFGPTKVCRWSYAESKAIDEYLALAHHAEGLPTVIVRYFNSYGPRLDPKGYGSVTAKFISQAMNNEPITVYDDGQQTRSFTYVTDTVAGTYLASITPSAEGMYFNIGQQRETSVLQLARMIKEILGSTSEIVHMPLEQAFGADFEETRRRLPDVRRARDILGFEAKVPLEQGLRQTITWFQKMYGTS